MSRAKSKIITPHFPPAEVIKLAAWKKRTSETAEEELSDLRELGLTDDDSLLGTRCSQPFRDLGVREGDYLISVPADVFSPPVDELCCVQLGAGETHIGFLRCDSLTRWRAESEGYVDACFHPAKIEQLWRVVGACRGSNVLKLRCKVRPAHPVAEIIQFRKRA